MIVAAGPEIIVTSIAKGFANVAFTGSLLLSLALTAGIVWYAKRRPVGTPLSWGQAMAAALYVTFLMFWAYGVVPDKWLNYAEGDLEMRSDAILAGPGSTGWLKDLPIVISKEAVAHIVTTIIYGLAFTITIAMWAVWQGRGDKKVDEVEKSSYGRPLVKA